MQLGIHIGLLAAVVVVTVVCSIAYRGRSDRSIRTILLAALPFILLGCASALLMNVSKPGIEWLLPATAVVIVGLTCKSDRVFTWFRWAMPIVALVLWINFMELVVHSGYTTATGSLRVLNRAVALNAKKEAAEALQQRFDSEEIIPEGPVSGILGEPKYDQVETRVVERQWHTPVTRLSRVRKATAALWYPGGAVETASEHLEVRGPAQVQAGAANRG